MAVGNPVRIIRRRFDDEMIELLEQLQWWNRPIEEIDRLMPILTDSDLSAAKAAIRSYLSSAPMAPDGGRRASQITAASM